MYDIAIIIINYRTPDVTTMCLQSVSHEIIGLNAKIIVVDNNSADGSIEIIKSWIDENHVNNKMTLLCSEKNLGFSGGNNLGITSIDSKYYLLLNSDTLVKPGAIKQLLKTAKVNKNTGLVTPRLEGENGSIQASCFRYISPISELIASAQTGLVTKLLIKFDVPLDQREVISSPPWTSFACVLVKKEVFNDIGLLDDGFFMYFEDTEFCYRARKASWNILNDPGSHVVHLQGVSSKVEEKSQLKSRLPRYYYESRTRYFYKRYGWYGPLFANLCWHTGRMISLVRQLFGRKDKSVISYQWRDIWINYFRPLK